LQYISIPDRELSVSELLYENFSIQRLPIQREVKLVPGFLRNFENKFPDFFKTFSRHFRTFSRLKIFE